MLPPKMMVLNIFKGTPPLPLVEPTKPTPSFAAITTATADTTTAVAEAPTTQNSNCDDSNISNDINSWIIIIINSMNNPKETAAELYS